MEDEIKQVRFVKKISINRNLYIPLAVFLLLVSSVSAVIVAYNWYDWTFNIDNSGKLTVTDVNGIIVPNPIMLNAYSGDFYEYNWSVDNRANRDLNFTLSLKMNESNLETDEAKLQIFDNLGNLLSESTTAVSNEITAEAVDSLYSSGMNKKGTIRVQFSPSADNNTYFMQLAIKPGSFTYK